MNITDATFEKLLEKYNEYQKDSNGRYKSWEYCYKIFGNARKNKENIDYDFLSLHLAFYLASWGMYRGSSFLLKKDYKIHMPIVKEILNDKYDVLSGIAIDDLEKDANQDLIINLSRIIKDYYREVRQNVANKDIKADVSPILVTKILMGTLGCTPAYDDFFVKGLRDTYFSFKYKSFSKNSLSELVEFYKKHKDSFENVRKSMKIDNELDYPPMKVIDMLLWEYETDPEFFNSNS